MSLEYIQVYGSRGLQKSRFCNLLVIPQIRKEKKKTSQAWWCRCVATATLEAKEEEMKGQG